MKQNASAITVLVADDDFDDQELIRAALQENRHQVKVITVADGIQVLDCLLKRHSFKGQTETPDLVLLDLNMPLMDGFDVLKEIRKHEALKHLPVYVITVSRAVDDWNRALDLGASGFYCKGTSENDLRRVIREVFNDCIGTLS